MARRRAVRAAVALVLTLPLAAAAPAWATEQQTPPTQAADDPSAQKPAEQEEEADDTVRLNEEVVVTGSRAQPRSATESMVPIDVLSTREFDSLSGADLSDQLRTLVPSYNVNTQPISDAATIVRPASLRNLAPDHTLVLINGERRHRAAVTVTAIATVAFVVLGRHVHVLRALRGGGIDAHLRHRDRGRRRAEIEAVEERLHVVAELERLDQGPKDVAHTPIQEAFVRIASELAASSIEGGLRYRSLGAHGLARRLLQRLGRRRACEPRRFRRRARRAPARAP